MPLEGSVRTADGHWLEKSGMDSIVCYYCGISADSIDHVVPRSLLADLADDPQVKAELIARGRILEVDCCRQCNGLLSNDYDQTLEDRKTRLRVRLRRRYARLLEMPDWPDSEVGQLGWYLQNYILTHSAMRDWVRARLAYEGPATRYGYRIRAAS